MPVLYQQFEESMFMWKRLSLCICVLVLYVNCNAALIAAEKVSESKTTAGGKTNFPDSD